MKKIDRILDLKDKYDVFAFDMWGTIWSGSDFFEGIENVLLELNRDKKVIIISNNPRRESKIEKSFIKQGLEVGKHYDEIYSSGGLFMKDFLSSNKAKIYKLYEPEDLFEDLGVEYVSSVFDADYISIGMPQIEIDGKLSFQMDMSIISKDLESLRDCNLPMLCSNPDLTAPLNEFSADGKRLFAIMPGTIAKYYEDMGGKVIYFGKPHNNIFEYSIPKEIKSRAIMIGDTIGTDVKGGFDYGIDTLFLQTGVSSNDAKELGYQDIEEYIKEECNGVKPTYILTKTTHF